LSEAISDRVGDIMTVARPQGGSKLQALINRHRGVRGTARNWNTARKLFALVKG